jgi:hypothetical protein
MPFRGSGGFSVPKHIQNVPAGEPQGQLYDLAVDPSETTNLYASNQDDVKRLSALLKKTKANGRTRAHNWLNATV